MEPQDKFGIRAELDKPDDPRPKLSRVTTVRELTAALSQCAPEKEIWITYSPPGTSRLAIRARRLEISDIFDEYETRTLGIDLHEDRKGKTADSDVDQEKLRIVLIGEAENVLGSKKKAHAWLNMPSPQLTDQTPMDLLATADGRNRVHELLEHF
jgi:hypothetical protein